MQKKPRTPKELANHDQKAKYSFYLSKRNVDILTDLADMEDIAVSRLIDEAIRHYLEAIREEIPTTKNRK